MRKWIINAYRKYRLMKRIRDERISGLPLVLPHSPPVVIRGTGPRQAPPKHDFGGKPPARNAFAVTHPFLAKCLVTALSTKLKA